MTPPNSGDLVAKELLKLAGLMETNQLGRDCSGCALEKSVMSITHHRDGHHPVELESLRDDLTGHGTTQHRGFFTRL